MRILPGEVDEKSQLAVQEVAVQFRALDLDPTDEAINGFVIEVLSSVRPLEGMGEVLIPGLGKVVDAGFQLSSRSKTLSPEGFAVQDSQPDLDQVEPGTVSGQEVENDPLICGLQPLFSLFEGGQLGQGLITQLGDDAAELR